MKKWKSELVLVALLLPILLSVCAVAQTPTPADAIALEQQGKLPEAAAAWRAVTAAQSARRCGLRQSGCRSLQGTEVFGSRRGLQEALWLSIPSSPAIELNLGLAEFKQGHFHAAAAALRAALAADPSNNQARTLLGLSYYGEQRFADAVNISSPRPRPIPPTRSCIGCWRKAVCGRKTIPAPWKNSANCCSRDPDSAAAHILTGRSAGRLGKNFGGHRRIRSRREDFSPRAQRHFGLGYLYWKSQQYDEARQEFEGELALDPNHAQALAYLGDIEWKNNHPEDAALAVQRAMSAQKNLRIVYVDLGAIYMQQKNYKDAQPALLHAVALDPTLPDAHYQLGRLYQAMGKTAEAEKELHKVQELHEKAEDSLVGKISSSPPALNPSEAQIT